MIGFRKSTMDINTKKEEVDTRSSANIETTQAEAITGPDLSNSLTFPLPIVAGGAAAGVVVMVVIVIVIILCKRKREDSTTDTTEYPEPFASSSNFFLPTGQDEQTMFGGVRKDADEESRAARDTAWKNKQTGLGDLSGSVSDPYLSESGKDPYMSDSVNDPYHMPSQCVVLRPKQLTVTTTSTGAAATDPHWQRGDKKVVTRQGLEPSVDHGDAAPDFDRQQSQNEAIYDVPKPPVKRRSHENTLAWTRPKKTGGQKHQPPSKSNLFSRSGVEYDVPRSTKAVTAPLGAFSN